MLQLLLSLKYWQRYNWTSGKKNPRPRGWGSYPKTKCGYAISFLFRYAHSVFGFEKKKNECGYESGLRIWPKCNSDVNTEVVTLFAKKKRAYDSQQESLGNSRDTRYRQKTHQSVWNYRKLMLIRADDYFRVSKERSCMEDDDQGRNQSLGKPK